MKNLLLIFLLIISAAARGQITNASLTASGLTCSMCNKAIYKALLKVPSIEKVDVDVNNATFNIAFKTSSNISIDDVKNAVENAGFSVASMKVTATFSKQEVNNDVHVTLNGTRLHFLNVQKQTLNGNETFTVVDKDYLPLKEYRKYGKYTKMECFKTGKMASCCPDKLTEGERIYHVTL